MRPLLLPHSLFYLLFSWLYSGENVVPNVGRVPILLWRRFDCEQPHRYYLIFSFYPLCLTRPRSYRVVVRCIVLPANQEVNRLSSALSICSAYELITTLSGASRGDNCCVGPSKSPIPYLIYSHSGAKLIVPSSL